MQKRYTIGALAVVLAAALCVIAYLILHTDPTPSPADPEMVTEPETDPFARTTVIGTSVEGRPLSVTTYGNGETHVLFVGGVHGGYEWNSTLLAYAFMDHLALHPEIVPENVMISVISTLNPDGTFAVVGKEGRFAVADIPDDEGPIGTGRFNARGVDLNRNFDCKWQPESTWRNESVSAGTAPFSEPEAVALRDFVDQYSPDIVVFWHSQANAVYASECEQGILPETLELMHAYAEAAQYQAISIFDAYPVTGDAEGWLASIGIPAITVELSSHTSIEWERNLAGIRALLAAAAS